MSNFEVSLQIMGRISSLWSAQALMTAANLGVADYITAAPRSVDDIAAEMKLHPLSLYRLLRGLSASGFFTENPARHFTHNPLSSALKSDAPGNLRNIVRLFALRPFLEGGIALDHTIKTGEPAALAENTEETFFDFLAANSEAADIYYSAMATLTADQSQTILDAYDFSDIETLADVGGGYGALLAEILKRNPKQRGILFDLPQVNEQAQAYMHNARLTDRCEIHSGSFYETVPTDCNAYILKSILHAQNDETSVKILKRIHRSSAPDARVFICELVIADEILRPHDGARIFDLFMLMGGNSVRLRSEQEFRSLFTQSGFKLVRHLRMPTCSLLEAVKVS